MMSVLDIHTHSNRAECAIICCEPGFFPLQKSKFYSVGIHPWTIDTLTVNDKLIVLADELKSHNVVAVGEAGIDKMSECSIALQSEVFSQQALLAQSVDKPLIIHAVKAFDELLSIKKDLKPSNPWIIHGFRGKPQLACSLLSHGFYLSFGEKYNDDSLKITPVNRLFIETDESECPITELYSKAAKLKEYDEKEFTETVKMNVQSVFFPVDFAVS